MTSPSSLEAWLRLLETRHPSTIDLGLERVGTVWQQLGQPGPAPRVITVAGTNGKGSTVNYLDAMLAALGFRSGSYTSPHVFRYNERVRIQGCEVADEDLVWAFDAVESARGSISLTYFEHGTLAAFLLMQRAELDFAVLEVGLGGRLDAVNLIDADCAVITPIGLDHQDYLGPDRESIGYEKAGILRAGRPLICGEAEPPASVLKQAQQLAVPLQCLGKEFHIEEASDQLIWRAAGQLIHLPKPPLLGRHQQQNLATALAALLAVIPEAALETGKLADGIKRACLPGRLPGRLQAHPDDPRVLVDVGHNPLAAAVVVRALQDSRQQAAICVLAMLRDKDAGEVVRLLHPQVQQWYCAGLAGARGRSGADLAEQVAGMVGKEQVASFETVKEALIAAVRSIEGQDASQTGGQGGGQGDSEPRLVLVFGSFHTAAEALDTTLTEAETV